MAIKPITVTQLNEYMDTILSSDPLLKMVVVQGEISSIKYHTSGHVYLTVSDGKSKLDCVIYESYARGIETEFTEGDSVILTGSIGIYKQAGRYNLRVRQIELAGEGELAAAFEKMKKKLAGEGLFDSEHKKEIPAFPKHIGVLTSATGAAVQDILKIIQSRNSMVDVTVFPVPVQGTGAGEEMAAMLDMVGDKYLGKIDTVIIGRGGGSPEDLACFNEEALARAIYRFPIPIISAVGHEIDFSISDLVADSRAETPTAAAQMAVPDMGEFSDKIRAYVEDMGKSLSNKLMYSVLQMDNSLATIKHAMEQKFISAEREMEKLLLIIKENDSREILGKGYVLVTDKNGRPVAKVDGLDIGGEYDLIFRKGKALCVIKEKEAEDEK